MKIKLMDAGYTTFTGLIGNIPFTNGTSNNDVSVETAAAIAAIYRIDKVVSGTDTGVLDVTSAKVNIEDTTGDFNAATNPAPLK